MTKVAVLIAVLGLILNNMHARSAAADDTKKPPTPGNFDSYVLAMSDENDFCAANPEKQECQAGAGADGMRLHGLWPDQHDDPNNNYQYCSSVSASQVSADWCASSIDIAPEMDPSILSQLATVMPGVDSCLYNHEWYAHGTCSGLTPDNYFDLATTLASTFIQLPTFQSFIMQNSGQTVSKAQLMQALEQDFGSQIDSAAILLCRKDDQGSYHFQEVDMTLNPQELSSFPSDSSLGQSKASGSCPDDGIILTASSQ